MISPENTPLLHNTKLLAKNKINTNSDNTYYWSIDTKNGEKDDAEKRLG